MAARTAKKTVAPVEVEPTKEWAFVGKEPSALHHDLAAFIEEETGIEADPKTVQAVLAMHGTWQKTDRVARRRRTPESILKGGASIVTNWEPKVAEAQAPAKPARKRAARKPAAPKATA